MGLNEVFKGFFEFLRPTTLANLAVLIAALLFGQWLLVIAYRLTLHPLARYPGRFVDKISSWPHIIRCYTGNRHVELLRLHSKYGPDWLEFDTAAAHQAINRDRRTNTIKHNWYTLEPAITGETSVQTVIDFKEHDFRRRVLAPAFSAAALVDHEVIIDENVREFLDTIAGKHVKRDARGWSESKDFNEWVTYFGYDFISDLAFGSKLGCMRDEEQRYIPRMVMRASHFINYAAYLPFPKFVRWLVSTRIMTYIDPSVGDGHKFAEKSAEMLAQREEAEKSGGRKDIFHHLINSKDPETGLGFTKEQLVADSVLLLAAGADGVSGSLSAALFYLLNNPGTLLTLVNEIRSSFSSFDEVRSPKLVQLPYLDGVVHEAIRLAPLVPSGLPRTVLSGGLRIDNIHVPAGTAVGVSAYAVHHNEEEYSDSFAFKPERWIDSEKNDTSAAKRALVSFSGGRFGCVGRNIAILTVKLTLAKLLWAYDVRPTDGFVTGGGDSTLGRGRERRGEYQMIDHAVADRSGPDVQFRPREMHSG